MYADDTKLYPDFSSEDEDSAHAITAECLKENKAWLLNENKTEAITVIPINQSTVAVNPAWIQDSNQFICNKHYILLRY